MHPPAGRVVNYQDTKRHPKGGHLGKVKVANEINQLKANGIQKQKMPIQAIHRKL